MSDPHDVRTKIHPSGWQTGFFRVADTPGNGLQQIYRNKVTGEFAAKDYDLASREPDGEWEPIYVYRGVPEKGWRR